MRHTRDKIEMLTKNRREDGSEETMTTALSDHERYLGGYCRIKSPPLVSSLSPGAWTSECIMGFSVGDTPAAILRGLQRVEVL